MVGTFDFLVDSLPFGYAFNFDNYLFNKIKHINSQGVDERADYFIVNNIKKRIEGKIHFLIKERTAYSPYKSLFGSFEFSPRIHSNLMGQFWDFIEKDLITRGIKAVRIVNYADCYAPRKTEIIRKILMNAGFSISRRATNHHIPIDENGLKSRIHSMEQRKLNKCKAEGLVFEETLVSQTDAVYDYIASCRREQEVAMSISREKLHFYLENFPQNYHLFSVKLGDAVVATTVAINVHRHILYNFLPASSKQYHSLSPTVLLTEGLYQYCQQHKIELLDLGISTESDGSEQESLIAFKERMGGMRSEKLFFEKNFG